MIEEVSDIGIGIEAVVGSGEVSDIGIEVGAVVAEVVEEVEMVLDIGLEVVLPLGIVIEVA